MKVRACTVSSSVVRGIALLYAAVFVASAGSTALAAGVVGTGTADSCTDTALDTALAGGGLVTFNCGGPATIEISSTKGITADTTIDGGGGITLSGGTSVRIFGVNPSVRFNLSHVTLANGNAGGQGGAEGGEGGAIFNLGMLTVTNSTFSANSVSGSGRGGAIFNDPGGTLTVTNSTFSSNTAFSGAGGAIDNFGMLTITNSTFIGNSAGAGGGIDNLGMLTITNSTFIGNSADAGGGILSGVSLIVTNSTFTGNNANRGGGIANDGSLTVTDSAFTGNSGGDISNGAGAGVIANSTFTGGDGIINLGGYLAVTNSTLAGNRGGIYTSAGTETLLRNTIVAKSSFDNCSGRMPDGPRIFPMDGGHNLDDGTTCGFSAANGSLSNTNPQLDPAGLQDNGGPTQTVALCTTGSESGSGGCDASSPAIDAGDPTVCGAAPVNNRDQRGFVRPGIGHTDCSIGAYEADATAPEACTGDCDGNGVVAINELIVGVNIDLGGATLDQCQAFDCNGDGHVTVDCLVRAVQTALLGSRCPMCVVFGPGCEVSGGG